MKREEIKKRIDLLKKREIRIEKLEDNLHICNLLMDDIYCVKRRLDTLYDVKEDNSRFADKVTANLLNYLSNESLNVIAELLKKDLAVKIDDIKQKIETLENEE
jgi:hypothetical protein